MEYKEAQVKQVTDVADSDNDGVVYNIKLWADTPNGHAETKRFNISRHILDELKRIIIEEEKNNV
jgi:hypothetical protein